MQAPTTFGDRHIEMQMLTVNGLERWIKVYLPNYTYLLEYTSY